LRRVGQSQGAKRTLESFDELTALVLGRAAVARQCGELVPHALERLRNRRCEFAQVAAQPRREAKRVECTHVGAVSQLEILEHSHLVALRPSSIFKVWRTSHSRGCALALKTASPDRVAQM